MGQNWEPQLLDGYTKNRLQQIRNPPGTPGRVRIHGVPGLTASNACFVERSQQHLDECAGLQQEGRYGKTT